MEKEKKYFQKVKKKDIIKDIGKMDIIKVKGFYNGEMDQNIKENLLMVRNKDLVFIHFLMEIFMKGIGLMVSNKGKGLFIGKIDRL